MTTPQTIATPDTVGPFVGVYSENVTHTLGFGNTKRRKSAKTYWLIERDHADQIFAQALNENMVPVGDRKPLSKEKFLADYCPEPDLFMGVTRPRMREIEEAVHKGDEHRAKEELFSAEVEYKHALQIDEEEIRANFGLGLTYLARGDRDKARYVFGKLVTLEAAFHSEHKHLFNEFGIELRKGRMLKEAVLYYSRALELAADDDHLLYNLARAHFELRQLGESHAALRKALGLNPNLAEAEQLLRVLVREAPSLLTTGLDLSERDLSPGPA